MKEKTDSPYARGYNDAKRGANKNPYIKTRFAKDWQRGWIDAHKRKVEMLEVDLQQQQDLLLQDFHDYGQTARKIIKPRIKKIQSEVARIGAIIGAAAK
jgi:hypothetical protein